MSVFFVGIKGTGMSALADAFQSLGVNVCGSDSTETFYTDALLDELGIPVYRLDDETIIRQKRYDFAVYSAAYDCEKQAQLRYFQAHDVPLYTYPQILGEISQQTFSIAVAGTHGKTTISGMSATLARELSLDGLCIVGGQIHSLGGRSVCVRGNRFILAETCEYRRHFLDFYPDILLIANIEFDHQDYFKSDTDIARAFHEFAEQLSPNGTLIYCSDDLVTSRLAQDIRSLRSDIRIVPYGRSAKGEFCITSIETDRSGVVFSVKKWTNEHIRIPLFGAHIALNATASLAISDSIQQTLYHNAIDIKKAGQALSQYSGAKRRMEVVGIEKQITVIDDYAHHPTAIKATLASLRESKRYKRTIVDFMPHTYSRTIALLDEFTVSFFNADIVIVHQIYASAREQNKNTITGEDFVAALKKHHAQVYYFPKPMDAKQFCLQILSAGDVFATLGAGDNWKLGRAIYTELTMAD